LYYFSETRPDMDAIFFTTMALIAFYRAQEVAQGRMQILLRVTGSILLVTAVLFKQTAAVFMLVPALAQFLRSGFRRQLLPALSPVFAVLAMFAAIRYSNPGLWHFIVEVPSQYHVPIARIGPIGTEFLISVPLFLFSVVHWLYTDAVDMRESPRTRWLLATLACAIPSGIIFFAKDGGAQNSLIPAILSVSAFCVWRAPFLFESLRNFSQPPLLRIAIGLLFGFMLFAHAYPTPGALSPVSLTAGHGTNERARIVDEARLLPGRVVCPDDPTIALDAKGYAGRTAVFEADASNLWHTDRIASLTKEFESADYVIVMRHGFLPNGQALVSTVLGPGTNDEALQASGFIKSQFESTSTPVYELWKRARRLGRS
jgi:hypothetical protein